MSTSNESKDPIRAAAAELGRRGGQKGGRAKSPAKTKAARKNAAKRWKKNEC